MVKCIFSRHATVNGRPEFHIGKTAKWTGGASVFFAAIKAIKAARRNFSKVWFEGKSAARIPLRGR